MQLTSMAPDTVPYVVLERCDPTRNMARYYVLSLEPSLFGDTALVRQWGRLGHTGRQRIDLFRQRAHAVESLDAWFARQAATRVRRALTGRLDVGRPLPSHGENRGSVP